MSEDLTRNIHTEEITLIKSVFKDNDTLLKTTRACMLGLGLTGEEKELLKNTYQNEALMKVLHRKFLPTLRKDEPIGQVSDVWLGVETQVFGQSPDAIEQAVRYKQGAIELTRRALTLLQNPDAEVEPIKLDYSPDLYLNDPLRIALLVRNQYIRHVEQQLLFLKVISEQKDETPEDVGKRLAKDSVR